MDFRFQTYLREWAVKNIGIGNYDLVTFAGASKDFETIYKMVDLSSKLHGISEVYLVNHEDCGAYGETGSLEKHTQDLKAAQGKIKQRLPQLQVKTYYLKLDGSFVEV
jgi:carbonic anhydrase